MGQSRNHGFKLVNRRMRQNDHLSEQRQIFIKEFCALGDHVEAARRAGYSEKTIANQACKLKRELASEIREELTLNFITHAPKALQTLKELAESSISESVRLQASRDLLDRAGFKPADRHELIGKTKTHDELKAELVGLVGEDGADLMLSGMRARRSHSGPELESDMVN